MFLPKSIHPSWDQFLTPQVEDLLNHIYQTISHPYNPHQDDLVLRFLSLDLQAIKVVWLGQDVYPAPGVATGRAFEAGNISSWLEPFKQVSLKNILRLIHKTYREISDYDRILSYQKIKDEISNGSFPILDYRDWFNSLEDQGVLFLNTSFTCQTGKANSHKSHWLPFTHLLLTYISRENPNLVWFLWGKEASKYTPYIEGKLKISRHPMMCSKKYDDDFLKSKCFEDTQDLIHWLG